jgi:glycosyltransferase involved in cell wall biosynthesis
MLVSVITIFKDEERFLPEAVDSVLAQSLGDWEYFLVDDGSTDRSTALAREYASRHAGIHYLHHPQNENRGMSASRNLALAASRGDVLALLDADDVWNPDKLARQIELFKVDPVLGMVFGAPVYWHSWAGGEEDRDADHLQELGALPGESFEPPDLAIRFIRDGSATPCPCDLMVRTSVARAVGGFVDEFKGLYEDQAFCVKVALNAKVRIGPSGLSRYRQHANSFCARAYAAGKHPEARRYFLTWLGGYLRETRPLAADLHQVVDDQLRRATAD